MTNRETLSVSVTYNSTGNIDLVLKRDLPTLSTREQNKLDAYFNITPEECELHLDALKQYGWELADVVLQSEAGNKMYYFKRSAEATHCS